MASDKSDTGALHTPDEFIVLGFCCVRPSQIKRLEMEKETNTSLRCRYLIVAVLHKKNHRVLVARFEKVKDVQAKLETYRKTINAGLARTKRLAHDAIQNPFER